MSDITSLPLPKERNLYFCDQVDQDTIETITKDIISINDNDTFLTRLYDVYDLEYKPKPINIYIDSYDGQVYQILGLTAIMEKSETPVHTYVTGAAMSAGFVMLISGHKRFAHKYSTVMLHQLSAEVWGTLKEMEDQVDEYKRLQGILESLILDKTKISKSKLKELKTGKIDWYMNASDAMEFGCIDQII